MTSLYWAPLFLSLIFTPSLKEFFRLGGAVRVVLPWGNGVLPISLSFTGTREEKSIQTNWLLRNELPPSIAEEAKVCCSGQPISLAGDLNADPLVIPSLAKGMTDGAWIDVGTRLDFALACPVALAAITSCSARSDRWFPPHFGILTEFSLSSWDAMVNLC